MKSRCTLLIKVIPLLLVMVASLCVNAQDSDFNYTIENDIQTAKNVLEFDLYVQDTDAGSAFKLSTIQAGIIVNPEIYNGGAITMSIIPGTSDLTNNSQKPFNVLWDQSRNVIQMTPPPIPDENIASIISQTAPGTRICRMRLTNTQPFTANSYANLTFNFTSPYPYPTKIGQFITAGLNHSTEIECNPTNSFNHSDNIVLNANPLVYDVTGSGRFCEGTTGLTVTLSNSQIGINYQLMKFSTKDGNEIAGTGAPLTWINKPLGIYSIKATNAATLITSDMNGNALIFMDQAPLSGIAIDLGICSGDSLYLGVTAINGNTYSWTSVPEGFTSTLSNPSLKPTIASITFTLVETVTETGCKTTKSVLANIHPTPTVKITPLSAVCSPETVDLTSTALTMESTAGITFTYWTDALATTSYGTPHTAITGTYYIKGETYVGCFDIKPVTVTVNQLPTIVESTSATCSTDLLTYSTKVTVNIGQVTSSAGTVTHSNNVWSINEIPSGTNITVTVTNINCSKTLSINAPDCSCIGITSPVSGGDKNYCSGGSIPAITASVLAGETVDWYVTPTGGIALLSGQLSYTPSYAGTYYAETRKTISSCKSSSRTEITITADPLPSAVTGDDRAICLGASTILGSVTVSGSNYAWTSLPVGFTSNLATLTVSPLVSTTYTLVETIILTGCTSTHSVLVTVKPLPAANAGINRTICSNTNTIIGEAPVLGSTYSWISSPAGFTSAEANPTVSPFVTTTYTVVETNTTAACTNTNSVVVTVNPLPAAEAGSDRGICPGTSTTLGAAAISGSTYSWISAPAGFSSTTANPSVTPSLTTTYTVTETITATGCTNTYSVVVTVNPLPAATAGADRAICLNTNTTLGAPAVPGSIYSWTSVPAGSLPTIAEPKVNPLVTTAYTLVETITATGCTSTNRVVVTVNPLTGEAGPITGNISISRGSTGIAYSVETINNATSYIWKYTGTGVTINGTGKNVTLDFSATASSGSLIVKGHNNCGDGVESSLGIGDTKTLNLTSVILEGLSAGDGTMNQAQDEYGAHWPAGVADHITVQLHSASNYGTIEYSASDIPLSTDGTATIIVPGAYSGTYYITINHRNSIETTSATVKSFASSTINQSFGTPASVHGSNLIQTNVGYAIYGGDANQDGIVDTSDMNGVDNGSTSILMGYNSDDINGDGIVDTSDMNTVDNNSTAIVMTQLP